ncbi:MAG TPA: hypothetical protein VE957_15810 [Terriglobales bacterium]|nr:hypothetical protein [Terriglobales bacterium]
MKKRGRVSGPPWKGKHKKMGQLRISVTDTLDGIPAIRYRDAEGQYPVLNLSQRSRSQANKRAKAILEGRVSTLGFLILNHTRRIAELEKESTAPLMNHPIRPDDPAVTFGDYTRSIIKAQILEIDWLNKQTCEVVDRRRSLTKRKS